MLLFDIASRLPLSFTRSSGGGHAQPSRDICAFLEYAEDRRLPPDLHPHQKFSRRLITTCLAEASQAATAKAQEGSHHPKKDVMKLDVQCALQAQTFSEDGALAEYFFCLHIFLPPYTFSDADQVIDTQDAESSLQQCQRAHDPLFYPSLSAHRRSIKDRDHHIPLPLMRGCARSWQASGLNLRDKLAKVSQVIRWRQLAVGWRSATGIIQPSSGSGHMPEDNLLSVHKTIYHVARWRRKSVRLLNGLLACLQRAYVARRTVSMTTLFGAITPRWR